jgi:protein JSN1
MSMNQSRSANTSQGNSPIEPPAGTGLRYPLGNGLGGSSSQSGTGRAGAGSPSKEYGSRLFPKRCVIVLSHLLMSHRRNHGSDNV